MRVDKSTNPVLGLIDLLTLPADHEIEVFRSGKVRIGNTDFEPVQSPVMQMTFGGLAQTGESEPLPEPAPTGTSAYVGTEIRVGGEAFRVRLREIQLDGQLGDPVECENGPFNIAVWDVTDQFMPVQVAAITAADA